MSWSAESRLAERIRERVANVVLYELQDPRLGFTTITRVRLAKDLSVCDVYYSVLGTPGERSRTGHALQDARGFVQREVAKVLHTRTTPHLRFRYDESVEGGMRVTGLLKQLEEERGPDPEDAGDPDAASAEPADTESPDDPDDREEPT